MHERLKYYLDRLIDRTFTPLVPVSSRLAVQYRKQVMFLGWEPEIRHIKQFARSGVYAIDVGANMGLYSYAMAKTGIFKKILAFEPNPELTRYLQSASLGGVTVVHKAISYKSGTNILRIPRKGNVVLSGWGSLEDQIDLNVDSLDADEFQQIVVETISLDDLRLSGVCFIKIDVEGHELSVLEGARQFFATNQPVCLIECRERNHHLVEAYFFGLGVGYHSVDTKAKYGFELSRGNFLFSTV